MTWDVRLHDAFEAEFEAFESSVQDALLAVAELLAEYGPQLGRPHVDALKGSRHANMKELRFEAADGEWRAAFAFDPERHATSWLLATNRAAARNAFTTGSSQKRMRASQGMWKP